MDFDATRRGTPWGTLGPYWEQNGNIESTPICSHIGSLVLKPKEDAMYLY